MNFFKVKKYSNENLFSRIKSSKYLIVFCDSKTKDIENNFRDIYEKNVTWWHSLITYNILDTFA